MTKPILTINDLIQEAKIFCEFMSSENHSELLGVTDGKAVGTYVEHKFQHYLSEHYIVTVGEVVLKELICLGKIYAQI